MSQVQFALDVLGQLVFDATTLNLRNSVVGMRASYFVGPLHLVSLNYKFANLLFAVLCWSKRNNKVSALFSIWLEQSGLGINHEF